MAGTTAEITTLVDRLEHLSQYASRFCHVDDQRRQLLESPAVTLRELDEMAADYEIAGPWARAVAAGVADVMFGMGSLLAACEGESDREVRELLTQAATIARSSYRITSSAAAVMATAETLAQKRHEAINRSTLADTSRS